MEVTIVTWLLQWVDKTDQNSFSPAQNAGIGVWDGLWSDVGALFKKNVFQRGLNWSLGRTYWCLSNTLALITFYKLAALIIMNPSKYVTFGSIQYILWAEGFIWSVMLVCTLAFGEKVFPF